jgi:predicted nucleic acid-binding protein
MLVDSNVPMYLVGAPHPHKADAQRLLERSIAAGERLVTDAEVFQEMLHRYVAIARREAIGPAFEVLTSLVDETFPVERGDVDQARILLETRSPLSARDAIHVAIMQRRGVSRILSFDSGFDGLPGVIRIFE